MTRMPGPDTTREYLTRRGDRVVLHDFVPQNCVGAIVTFPIKGTIHYKGHPRKKKFQIWTLEGRANTFKPTGDDIVDLPPVLGAEVPGCADCHGTPITPPAGLPFSSQ